MQVQSSGKALRLSVLDQSPVSEGSDGSSALRNTIALARLADRLGYHRFWVAEHHGSPALACTSPEALIGPIATATERIRVGSGGVMLPHYSAYKVAETFSVLAGLFPGRIDLGLGRAPGTDVRTQLALQRTRRSIVPQDFLDQLKDVIGYTSGTLPEGHEFSRLADVMPGLPERSVPWLLGSSEQSGVWAAELGLPYVFADFINADGAPVAEAYRETFVPSPTQPAPYVGVAAWVVCAETDDEAERLASSSRMMLRLLRQGQLVKVPSVETATQYLADNPEPADSPTRNRRTILGTPATIRAKVEALAEEYGADEVLMLAILHDPAAKLRSYELIADAFGMS
ncbi:MAG TPA: LLM class flavin-dependent oxidoreductase [Capsulimonadaceae bacterium]|jgi:luciferase family oxidoreductase group 1